MLKLLKSLPRLLFEAVIVLIVVLDELARPIYRPLIATVARWRPMQRFEAWVAGHGRFAILILLAVPLAIVEPMKFLALVWAARGHYASGTLALGLAYLASFIVVERIYSAGKPKLMTFPWFAWGVGLMLKMRGAVLEVLRTSALWQGGTRLAARLRAAFARFRTGPER
ncbi:hypothetical protein [Ancylobacter defluvii]|uniref:Uncharacterized protein n=1 Tax=Ancylobacter defluvii TaxID=1282440 RepID=A0A9W6JUK7_9HYPH|nr:hypothetical protein [Ancylobacter defluvii]MBS7585792.1 hypothetical protein [Ancylobacter defluvii]GLK84165.1 hypothetical protein GCM10017653_22350 [Ancylobacter defluvii]